MVNYIITNAKLPKQTIFKFPRNKMAALTVKISVILGYKLKLAIQKS